MPIRLSFASLAILVLPLALTAAAACGGDDTDDTSSSNSSGGGAQAGGRTSASGGSATGGGGGTGGGPFMTAKHTPVVMKEHQKAVLAHPEVVSVTFAGDDQIDFINQFGDWIVTSDYFGTAVKEYGVGTATHLAKVTLSDPLPANDKELNQLLQLRMGDGTLPSPTDHPEAVYMTYFPKAASFDDQGKICEAFDGYHSIHRFGSGGPFYVYAIIGDCLDDPHGMDSIGNTASHELSESATDPFLGNGWFIDGAATDPNHWVSDDEVADLCEYFPSVEVEGYRIARLWSDAAAVANENPCIPVPDGEVFRNVDAAPATLQTVARGQSTTFTLTGWSTAPTGPWFLNLDHATYYSNQVGSFKAKATLSKPTINNGGTVELKVTVPADAPVGALGMIGIYSDNAYAESIYVGVIAQ